MVDANWRLVFSYVVVCWLIKNDAPVTDTSSNSEIRKLKCDSDEMICEPIGMYLFFLGLSTNFCQRNFVHDKFLVHLQNHSHFTYRVLHVEMSPE